MSRFANSKISMLSWSFTSNSKLSNFLNISLSMIMTFNFETLLTNLLFTHLIQKWIKIDLFINIWRVFQKALVFSFIVEFRSTSFSTMIALTNSNLFFRMIFIFTKFNMQILLKLFSSTITILFFWSLIWLSISTNFLKKMSRKITLWQLCKKSNDVVNANFLSRYQRLSRKTFRIRNQTRSSQKS